MAQQKPPAIGEDVTALMGGGTPAIGADVSTLMQTPTIQPVQPRTPVAARGTGYDPANVMENVQNLPTMGGVVGGTLGGPLGAGIGGATGETVRQLLNFLTGRDEAPRPAGVIEQGALQGGLDLGGQLLGRGMAAGGRRLMQSAVKPSIKTEAGPLVQTMLDEGITVSRRGLEKLNGLIAATDDEIRAAVRGSPAEIDTAAVATRIDDLEAQVSRQVDPAADVDAVRGVRARFLDANSRLEQIGTQEIPSTLLDASGQPMLKVEPLYGQVPQKLTPVQAQDLKTGTYRELRGKYDPTRVEQSAQIRAEKALARGLKEELEQAIPGIQGMNARQGARLDVRDVIEHRLAIAGNRDPFGMSLAASHPLTFLTWAADRSVAFKSLLARGMYVQAAQAARVSPQAVRAALAALGQEPDESSVSPKK